MEHIKEGRENSNQKSSLNKSSQIQGLSTLVMSIKPGVVNGARCCLRIMRAVVDVTLRYHVGHSVEETSR